MTVLITGGAGYVGSHTAHLLVETGQRPVVLDDLSRGIHALVPDEAAFVRGDIGDAALLDRLFTEHDIDAVIHFAGYIIVPESVDQPLLYYERNVSATRTLIDACVRHGVRHFIFSSSAAVYGAPAVDPIPETAALKPVSPYGRSKLMTEMMLEDAEAAHGLRSISLRYFNVAGADPKGRCGQVSRVATHLLKVASQVAIGEREKLTIFGRDYDTPDGTCVRDYVHASDLADAHLQALTVLRDGGPTGAFNCGYGKGVSILEALDAFGTVLGRPLPVEDGPRRPGDPPTLVADVSALRSQLGWQPRYNDLELMIRTAMEWEKRAVTLEFTPL